MDINKFLLSFYKNATKDFHIFKNTSPSEALKLHSHDYFQIYYVLQGSLLHHITSDVAELSGGDVFILPPNIPHFIEVKTEPVIFFSMSFTRDFLQNEKNKLVSDFLQTLISSPIEKIQPKLALPPKDMVFADAIFKRVDMEFSQKKMGHDTVIKECVSLLLALFARLYFENNAERLAPELKKQTALHCLEYLQTHFDEPLTPNEMARKFAMSKTSFCNMFSSIAGSPFKTYLNSLRIQKACEMLSSGEKATLVAEKCGFRDFSTFHRNFKKEMGISPTQWRLSGENK